MRALIFNTPGPAATVLQLVELAKPKPRPDQVLIQLINSPINPADLLFIEGRYRHQPQLPQIAGLEGCGHITEIGSALLTTMPALKVGTLVSFRARNAWAEYVALTPQEFTPLPMDFPQEKAGLLTLNPFTAYGLLQQAALQAGDWLLLTAANSMVAKITLQLASRQGINTIAVVRHGAHSDALKVLGASTVLVADDSAISLAQQVMNITQNIGLNAIMDAVGGPIITQLIPSLAPRAQLFVYGLFGAAPTHYPNSALVLKNLTIKGFGVDQWLSEQSAEVIDSIKQSLITQLSDPSFLLPIGAQYSFESFANAFNQPHSEKVLLIP